jgi:signal transduction histidine kinase
MVNVLERYAGRARVVADVGLGVVFAAALTFTAYAIADSWGGAYWQFDLAAGVVVCVIALVRRRNRAWAAIAGLAVAAVTILVARAAGLPAEPGPAMALALAVLVGSAVRTLPAQSAGAIAAAGLAVVAGSWAVQLPSASGIPGVATLNAVGWLAALALALALRSLDAGRRATVEKVRRDERLELARELHDVVAHHITGIVVQAQGAQVVARRHPEKVVTSLAGIETAGSDALAAMRRVVGLLRDNDDAPPATPGPEQLSDLVRRFERHGPAVALNLPDGASVWPPEVTSTVYRVVQESLTNVSSHAPHAGSVTVTVAQDRKVLTVEVVDDGTPVPARHQRGGYGLIGMRERLEALGGTLKAGPLPGAGWSVLATLPVPARERR